MNARNAMDNRQYDLAVSVGFTSYDPAQPCLIDDLLQKADEAMYEQKRAKHGLA
jgi:GGDEF domain-containing protein